MKAPAVLGVNVGTGKEFESTQVRSYAIHELRNSAKTAATALADKTRPVSQKKQDFLAKYDPLLDIGHMLSCELTGNELMSGGADLLTCSLSRFLEPTPEHLGGDSSSDDDSSS